MGLQSLVGISLEQITPAKETIKRLLDAAARHIADSKVNAISAEKLRKQRNLTEHTGDLIPESAVSECLSQAQSLHTATLSWLKANKTDLL